MSRTIDERVVEMRFDNKQFESNAGQTMSTLEKLKNALNFKNANDGLDRLGQSVKNVNMNPLANGVEAVREKFSALEVMAVGALLNISNKITDAATSMVKLLTIDQVTAGWDKYADKTSSVQTIMAATAQDFADTGEQMQFVNDQLEKLNWFTDETSYNFVDMVSNIGKFTSNNIALDKSVTAMQGIATWAAISGANAGEASRAMYNLSQAIAVGSVKLIDWKSIENANMATAAFKETVLETATSMGTLKKTADGMYETIGKGTEVTVANFNAALAEGWFTSDVLLSTLDKYGSFTNKLYEVSEVTGLTATEMLQWMDAYRDAGEDSTQVINDMAKKTKVPVSELTTYLSELTDETYALGEKAFRAAQEAKTFQEAIDATKDAVSTGWMKTWEIIFGDYEKAKVRWTDLANELYDVFAAGAEARNDLLTEALGMPKRVIDEGGWDDLAARIEKAGVPVDKFTDKLIELGEEAGAIDGSTISGIDDFVASLKDGWLTVDMITEAIDSFIGPINNVDEAVVATTKTFEDFKNVVTRTIRGDFGNGAARFDALAEAGWNAAVVQNAVNKAYDEATETFDLGKITVEDFTDAVLGLSEAEQIAAGYTEADIETLKALRDEYAGTGEALDNIKSGSDLLFDGISQGWNAIKGIFSAMKQGWEVAFPAMTADRLYNILKAFNSLATSFNEWVGNFEEDEDNPLSQTVKSIKSTFAGLGSIVGIGLDAVKAFVNFLSSTFGGSIGNGIDRVLGFTGSIGDFLVSLREWLRANEVFSKGIERMYSAILSGIDTVKNWFAAFKELPWVQEWLGKLTDGFNSFTSFISSNFPNATAAVQDLLSAFQNMWKNKDFSGITSAVKSFASALKDDLIKVWEQLKRTKFFGGFTEGLAGLWNAIKNLDPSTLPNWIRNIFESIKSFLQPVTDFFKKIKDTIVDRAKEIGDGVLTIASVLEAGVEYIREHIGGIIAALGLFVGSVVVAKFIKTILNLATVVAHPVKSICNAFDAFAGAAKGIKNAFNALAIVEIVAAIGGLALTAAELGKIPPEQLWTGVGAIVVLGALVGAIIYLMSKLTESKSLLDPAAVKTKTDGMLQVLELAGALFLVAEAFAKIAATLKTANEDEIWGAIEFLAGAIAALAGVSFLLSTFGGTGGGGKAVAGPIIAIAIALVAIAYVFSDLVNALHDADPNDINQALNVLGWIGDALLIFTVVMGIMSKVPTPEGSKVSGIGIGLLAAVISLKVLISALKDIIALELTGIEEKIPMMIGIAGAIVLLMIALSKMPASAGLNGIGLLAAAAAIDLLIISIRAMAAMSIGDIAKGVIAIGAMMLFMGLFTKLTASGTQMTAKSSIMFLVLSVSIGILAGVIALMSLLDPGAVLIGTAAISALMLTLGVMVALASLAKNLKVWTLIGLTAVVAVLGGVIIALGLMDPNNVLIATEAMTQMMIMMGIMSALTAIAQGLKIWTLIGLSAVVLALAGSIAIIADLESGVGKAVAAMAAMMGLFSIMSLVMGIVAIMFNSAGGAGLVGIALCIATIAVLGLVIVGICKWTNVQEALGIMEQMSGLFVSLSGLMIACGIVGALGGAALVGIAILDVLIADMILVLAGIAGLNKLMPGMNDFLASGLPTLEILGQGIDAFIGGIGNKTTDALPAIGESLSAFGEGFAPFAEAVKGIDESAVTGVRAIASMLLALGASDLMNAVTKLLGGDVTTLADFSSQLPGFATNLKQFSDNLGDDFKTDAMSSAADAASILTDIANSLPTTGGWKAKILGDPTTLAEFGESIIAFAEDLGSFCSQISEGDIDPAKISSVAEAASSLVDLVNNLPAKDGWKQKILGDPQGLDTFGESLGKFGSGIYALVNGDGTSNGIADLTDSDLEAIDKAVTAGEKLKQLQEALPDEDGWLKDFFGGGKTDLSEFGEQLSSFGEALVAYSTSVAELSGSTAIEDSIAQARALIFLSSMGGMDDTSNLKDFGKNLEILGQKLFIYHDYVSNVDTGFLSLVITQINRLVAIATNLSGVDLTAMSGFGSALETMAANGIADFCAAFEDCDSQVQPAIDALISVAENAIASKDVDFRAKGTSSATNYLNGIEAGDATTTGKTFAQNVIDALDSLLAAFKSAGGSAASNYISGIQAYYGSAALAGAGLRDSVIGAMDGYGAAYTQGSNFGYGFIAGISGWDGAAYNAAYSIGRSAVSGLQSAIDAHSPSREAAKMGDYTGIGYVDTLLDYVTKAYNAGGDVGNAALDGINKAIAKIATTFDDTSLMSPVIRPVVDLTDAQKSVTTLNSLFSRSIGIAVDSASAVSTAMSPRSTEVSKEAGSADKDTNGGNTYQFIQNNTSPKALSRYEIYRATRNQFKQFKEATDAI